MSSAEDVRINNLLRSANELTPSAVVAYESTELFFLNLCDRAKTRMIPAAVRTVDAPEDIARARIMNGIGHELSVPVRQ